jgi:hypothetical protein
VILSADHTGRMQDAGLSDDAALLRRFIDVVRPGMGPQDRRRRYERLRHVVCDVQSVNERAWVLVNVSKRVYNCKR